jgi:hypothetical protein
LSNLLEPLIVVEKKAKILKRDVDFTIAAFGSMFFERVFAAAERVFVDLDVERAIGRRDNDRRDTKRIYFVFDSFGRIGEKDGRVRLGCRHFRLRTLQCRKETRMKESRLRKVQS